MDADCRSLTPYWDWIEAHDLTLVVDKEGRLWKFREAHGQKDRTLDARLEADALVITRSSCDLWDDVDSQVCEGRVTFRCVRTGSEILCSEVLLPDGLALDGDSARMARWDGVVEVRLPLAGTAVEGPAVASGVHAA
jgi:hypothetical protein